MPSEGPQGVDLRQSVRLSRQPEHSWQLRLEDDRLITKNIVNLSATGMAFKAPSSSDIHPGQTLKFNLSIEPGTSFECEGSVLWAKASTDKPGSMRQFGIQFSKLPVMLDAAIVKQVNDFALKSRREHITKGRRPLTQKLVMSAPPSIRSFLVRIFGALLIMSMTSAFLVAIWMHRENNQNLTRKVSSSTER